MAKTKTASTKKNERKVKQTTYNQTIFETTKSGNCIAMQKIKHKIKITAPTKKRCSKNINLQQILEQETTKSKAAN